jgi:carotenoid cleavage dioxygenase-like enzyme
VLRTRRTEHTSLPLAVVEGSLPTDLHGHLFVAAPAGTFDAEPAAKRTTIMVGDGLVSRFDLGGGGVKLTTRLARTHDFVADEITHTSPDLSLFRFGNAGLVRLGLLGTRDFANTAFVPMKKGSDPTRLVLTYDAGRPVEIDPVSLEVITPVGRRADWRAEALPDAVFPVVLSPAHPAFDPATGELFTMNYGRGVANFAATVPLVHLLQMLPTFLAVAVDRLASVVGVEAAFRFLVRRLERATTRLDRRVEAFIDRFLPFIPDTFTDLVRWDGEGAFERWRLVLPSGREVSIEQSIHQIAVTEKHVVVLETGFKIGMQSAFNDPVPKIDAIDRLLRAVLTRPQLPYTALYVVPRVELDETDLPIGDDGVRRVRCRRVEIPVEADHFLADYDDADGRVTVHVAHSPATDLSEWVRPYDVNVYSDGPIDPALHGMLAVGAMDVGRFGRYVIDGASGEVLESRILVDEPVCWALALYAGRAINTDDALPRRLDTIYWCSEGAFPELLTEFVQDLYEDYPHRLASLETIRGMGRTGRPSAILRVDTRTMSFADRYVLPSGVMAGSLQFVPRPGSTVDTDGYLVGTMYTPDRTELWILDAQNLAQGPVAKLAADDWVVGFSLHTAWLPSIEARTAAFRASAREELAPAVAALSDETLCPGLKARFEADLYPRFE